MKNSFRLVRCGGLIVVMYYLFTCMNPLHAQWVQTNGPEGGNVQSILIMGDTILIGTRTSGVFRSTNGGSSWTFSNSGFGYSHLDVRDLSRNGNKIFASLADDGLFASSDFGATWTNLNFGAYVYKVVVKGTNLFCAGFPGGVYRSSDNGTTWEIDSVGLGAAARSASIQSIAVRDTILFVVASGGPADGVYRSTNNGSSWSLKGSNTQIGYSVGLPNAILADGQNLYVLGTGVGCVKKTTDDGETWNFPVTGLDHYATYQCITRYAGAIHVGVQGNPIMYRTTDEGASWSPTGTSGLGGNSVAAIAGSGTKLFAGSTPEGLFVSTDNGATWTSSSSGLRNTFIKTMSIQGTTIYAADGRAVFSSTDRGGSWVRAGSGLPTQYKDYLLASSPIRVFAARTDSPCVYGSTNSGATWSAANSGLPATGSVVAFAGKDTVLFLSVVTSGVHTIYRSLDGGATWSAASSGVSTSDYVYKIAFGAPYVYAGGAGNTFYRSLDNGDHWVLINSGLPSGNSVNQIVTVDSIVFVSVVGGPASGLYKSTDRGITWSTSSNVYFSDATIASYGTNLLAGPYGGKVFFSPNYGRVWTDMSTNLSQGANLSIPTFGFICSSGDSLALAGTPGQGVWKRPFSDFAMGTSASINAKTLLFPDVKVGQWKDTVILITNTNNVRLNVSSSSSSSSAFDVRTRSFFLAPGQTYADTVRFMPSKNGLNSGTIVLTGNAVSSPDTIHMSGTGLIGVVQLASKEVFAGVVRMEDTKDSVISITNSGNDTLKITDITSSNAAFSARPKVFAIPPGATHKDTLRFHPAIAGYDTCRLVIVSNGLSSRDTITWYGFGRTHTLSIAPQSVSFGSIQRYAWKDSTFKIVNTSNYAVRIDSMRLNAPSFSITGVNFNSSPYSVTDTLTFGFRFEPQTVGLFNGTAIFYSESTTSPDTVRLSGLSYSHPLQFNVTTIDFGKVKLGQYKDTLVTMTNIGEDTVSGYYDTLTISPPFSIRPRVFKVPPGNSIVDTIRFEPGTAGSRTSYLDVTTNAGGIPPSITLKGYGVVYGVSFDAAANTDFGSVAIGRFKDTVVTVRNTGNDTITINNITFSDPAFSARRTSFTLFLNQTYSDTVRFAPTTLGLVTAYALIYSNVSPVPDTVKISGTGTPATGVDGELGKLPTVYLLGQNYPNPFNPSTTIQYALPAQSRVRLQVYNTLGQIVADLVNAEQAAGWNQVMWEANVASGLYFYRLEAVSSEDPNKRFVQVRKMLMLK
jgi:photosystem II stability/assembly factor-like uncharacterized protein